MWSDEELDREFRRLAPPDTDEPAPHEQVPFPLDSWLDLERQLDTDATKRLVRRRMWQLVGAEVLVLLLALLAWQGWRWHQAGSAPALLAGQTLATEVGRSTPAKSVLEKARAAQPASATTGAHIATTTLAGQPPVPVAATAAVTSAAARPVASAYSPAISSRSVAQAAAAAQATHLAAAPADTRRRHTRAGKLTILAGGRRDYSATSGPWGTDQPARTLSRSATVASAPGAASVSPSHSPYAVTGPKQKVAHARNLSGLRPAAFDATNAAPRAQTQRQREAQTTGSAAKANAGVAITQRKRLRRQTGQALLAGRASRNSYAAAPIAIAQAIDSLALRRAGLRFSLQDLPQSLALLDTSPTPAPQPEPRFNSPRLLLTAAAAPDLSTVRFADVQLPQLGYGLLVEYRLTPFLRLQTGLLHSTKTYRARRNDYDWSGAPNALRNNFDWVEGSCTILDLPITLRQDWLRRPTHTVFTAVGVSSYLLQREHYSYDAVSPSPAFTWQKDLSNENKALFSVLNLSFGYERRLSARWSWQAEPYLKVPLTGIGFGKVQLLSGGVLVGVKYGL